MRNAKLYRAGSVESPRSWIRSRSLGNGMHHVSELLCTNRQDLLIGFYYLLIAQVRHVGWPAAIRDVYIGRDVL